MTDHVATKHALQGIGSLDVFDGILSRTTLNDDEKRFLKLYYIEKKDMRFISDTMHLGGEKQASRMHRKILRSVYQVL